ncbi:MAG: bifunctional folylpolyglutamate synthase/dihydrofolate synthase, partial [Candidatus Dormibacteraeota bacterium]|nr:bifunctional folylpolyglutamate synthase/dihydrofolate synthase [Candidatus Dormibacteraeota bacterium]
MTESKEPTTGMLTYEEALSYVTQLGRFGIKLGLERSRAILDQLGHPERGLRGALVAGTNGKGSTAAYLASILRARGLHVGTTPSPHLRSYTERVQLDGRPISEHEFAAAVSALQPRLQPVWDRIGEPTEFELLIGLAVWWLAPRVDRMVVEVGMGGRLDSTNVLDLGVAVITNIDLDHMKHLGDTVEKIASEKAGIIKSGNVVVTGATGPALAVIEARAREVGATTVWRLGQEITYRSCSLGWSGSELSVQGPGFRYDGLRVPLLGGWQPENAALAVAAAHAAGDATGDAVREGLAATRWPGRMQPVDGWLLLDGGHNAAALRRVVPAVRELAGERPLALVFGVMVDKDLPPMLEQLRQLEPAHVVTTAAASAGGRALSPAKLAA